MWAYHSFISMNEDLNAGLIGPTVVYPSGKMNTTMASHREFTLLYSNFDESNSFMSSISAKRHGINNATASIFPPLSLAKAMATNPSGGPSTLISHRQINSRPQPHLSSTPSTDASMPTTTHSKSVSTILRYGMCTALEAQRIRSICMEMVLSIWGATSPR